MRDLNFEPFTSFNSFRCSCPHINDPLKVGVKSSFLVFEVVVHHSIDRFSQWLWLCTCSSFFQNYLNDFLNYANWACLITTKTIAKYKCLEVLVHYWLEWSLKGIGGSRPKKIVFVHFDICYSPIFLLSKMGSYVTQLSILFILWASKWRPHNQT